MKGAATYDVVKTDVRQKVFWLIDRDGAVSVTNDAERVVSSMNALMPGCRVIYRDTMGNWDELRHDYGIFTGFAPARDMAIDLRSI